MKKIIILSYAFPPSNAIGMHRVLRFGKAFKALGYHPIIITTKNSSQTRQDKELVATAEAIFSEVYYIDSSIDRWLNKTIHNNRYGVLSKIVRKAADIFLFPDRNILWANAAYRFCLKLLKHDKDIAFIWASMSPFSSGIVANRLSNV
jgi:hypothetical protein